MEVRRASGRVLTARMEEGEKARDYLLDRSIDIAYEEELLPRVFTYDSPESYQAYIREEDPEEFENLSEFERWVNCADYGDQSLALELFDVGDHSSVVVLAYEERDHVDGLLTWPSSVPERFDAKIEVNLLGDRYRDMEGFLEEHFPELMGEL